MNEKRKGIIIDDPAELYVETDTSYYYPKHRNRKINKVIYHDKDIKIIHPEFTKDMVVLAKDDKNYSKLFFLVDRVDNELKCFMIKRTKEEYNDPKYVIIKRNTLNGFIDYILCEKMFKIDVNKVIQIEYFTNSLNRDQIINKHNKILDYDKNEKNDINYNFGDVLSLYGTKEKVIFICKRGKFIYTCSADSFELFTGMKRISKDNAIEKYGELNEIQKEKLLLKLSFALEFNKCIPKKVKENVKKLVFKHKANKM